MIIADISIRRPVFATVIILMLMIVGLVSYYKLNIDENPNVEFPFISIETEYQGAGPEQIESKVTKKIEDAVGSVTGVKHIYSYSNEGYSLVFIEFTLDTPAINAAQDVRTAIAAARSTLPDGIKEPVIKRFDPMQQPLVSLAFSSQDQRQLSTLINDQFKRRFEAVQGVGKVEIIGSQEREIQINVDRDALASHQVTITQIAGALMVNNGEKPSGQLKNETTDIGMRTAGKLSKPEDFLDLPVVQRENQQLYLRQFATISDGVKEQKDIARLNGKPTIGMNIVKQSGSNTVEVTDRIIQTLESVKKELPPGVEVAIVRDTSIPIRESLHEVMTSMLEGGILAILMVFLFLRDWRSTAISTIALPASVIATFALMKMANFTLNTMSLMALSLSIGFLIDDAIVVIENIHRHMKMGKGTVQAAMEGTSEIGLAVSATTFTIVAVFLPVAGMTGIIGQFFKEFGLTVVFAVLISLFVAFSLTPMLCSKYLSTEHGRTAFKPIQMILDWWQGLYMRGHNFYLRLLPYVLKRRMTTLGVAALIFIGSIMTLPLIGTSFLPITDRDEFSVGAKVDAGLSLEVKASIAANIEKVITSRPEVAYTYTSTNGDTLNFYVKLIPKKERKLSAMQLVTIVRQELPQSVPGVTFNVMASGGGSDDKPMLVSVRGENTDELERVAAEVERVMKSIPGTVDVENSYVEGKPNFSIRLDRNLAADTGINVDKVASTLWAGLTGIVATKFEDGQYEYDVRVRLNPAQRRGVDDLNGIYVESTNKDSFGRDVMLPLDSVARIEYTSGPAQIRRVDRSREIRLSCNLAGISLGELQNKLDEAFKKINKPSDIKLIMMGEAERMNESNNSIVIALGLAVVFIYLILAAQFESWLEPLAIMFSLPLAIVGALLALLLVGNELSIMANIGIIMLMGLVTKNAILLIEVTKQIRNSENIDRTKALVMAADLRLRPIMMTTMAMIFGMLPLAVALTPGAEDRAPMAQAIIGGLITSTFLTLVVVPVIYTVFDDIQEKISSILHLHKNGCGKNVVR